MYPAVQVLWINEQSQMYYFVRLHPNLRFQHCQLALDGTKTPETGAWKSRRGGWD